MTDQQESVTIKQAQDLKVKLEVQIREMLRQFSDKTGLCINRIELNTTTTMDGMPTYWPELDVSL
jgi:hypothetical protein